MTEQQKIWETSFSSLQRGIERLVSDTQASAAMVVRGDGQVITWSGSLDDPGALGALAAGSMAASGAMLRQIAARGSPSQAIEDGEKGLFLQTIEGESMLVVSYGRACSLGLVRLRARRLADEARAWLAGLRAPAGALDDLDPCDLDALFS